MLLAYFQIMVFESFASMMIEALRTMPTATMVTSKNAEPTIILMEESRQYGAAPVLVFTSAAATRGTVDNRLCGQPSRPAVLAATAVLWQCCRAVAFQRLL